jgi:hypothetical protein
MARTAMPQLYGGEIATGELAHYFDRRFFINLLALRLPRSILEVWISPVPIGQEGNL